MNESSPPTHAQLVKMEQAARVAARRYRGSVLEQQEREQIAWVELLEARKRFDPTRGVDFFPYCLRVAINALRRASIEARSPVGGCKHRVERMRAAKGVAVDVPLSQSDAQRDRTRPELEDHVTPEIAVDEVRFRHAVRKRVRALVGREAMAFAFEIGVKDFSPAEIARHNGLSRAEVYKLRRAVRNLLASDGELFRLWKERL